ncbi:MAG: hypothetical protein HY811_07565 [Planctomycetes bacterium]|nr:hypothetical protein [Planctomycetota bacterium]
MQKQTIETLDKINPIWLLRQISVDNLVRGINWIGRILIPIKKCAVSVSGNIKESIAEAAEEMENPKSKGKKITISNKTDSEKNAE